MSSSAAVVVVMKPIVSVWPYAVSTVSRPRSVCMRSTRTTGTTEAPVRYALKSFVSHKGPSVHSGHYVAHIRVGDEWVLFNDEKVVRADAESVRDLKRFAYLYVFERY